MGLGIENETMEYKKSTGELKDACVSICAMLNKHQLGTVYFGVKPNGDVVGQTVTESSLRDVSRVIYEAIKPQIFPAIQKDNIEGRDVIRVEVNGTEVPYSAFGKYYIRTADEDREVTSSELRQLFLKKTQADSWETLDSGVPLKEIETVQVRKLHENGIKAGRLPDVPFRSASLLKKMGLTDNGNLKNAGNILFGSRRPLQLKLAIFATDEKLTFLDMKIEEGNIFDLLPLGEQYILKNIRWRTEIDGMERREIPEIPVAIIRELLANSFAHALYHANTVHEIDIHPGMIVIYNPGSFANPYTPSDYIKKNLPSVLRNELIAKTLYIGKWIEEFGSGLKRVDSLCRDAGIRYNFENSELGFKAIIYRSLPLDVTINVPINVTLNGTEISVLALLKQHPDISRDELAEKVSKTVRTVQRALDSLKEKGIIERDGSRKFGRWIVKKYNI
ncbi:MAG: putative DNA binding domain-containing protein [bacterium]|nr:putative DNA binding domain-containing protein [bacterium]